MILKKEKHFLISPHSDGKNLEASLLCFNSAHVEHLLNVWVLNAYTVDCCKRPS